VARVGQGHQGFSSVVIVMGTSLRNGDDLAPSYPVVRRIIAGLNRGLLTVAHHGPEAYRNEFELVLGVPP
jgi:hypothetical protein